WHEIIDDEVLPRRNHQERGRAVLPKASLFRVGRSISHGRVKVGEVAVGNILTPFAARVRVDAAQIQGRIPGQEERGGHWCVIASHWLLCDRAPTCLP